MGLPVPAYVPVRESGISASQDAEGASSRVGGWLGAWVDVGGDGTSGWLGNGVFSCAAECSRELKDLPQTSGFILKSEEGPIDENEAIVANLSDDSEELCIDREIEEE